MELVSETLFLPFCLILSCFFIFITVRIQWNSTGSAMLPPGPPRLPIIGNIHQVGKLPHRSFSDLSRTYGPIMQLKFGRLNTVIITSSEAAREVLRTHDHILSGRMSPNAVRSINHHKVSVAWIHPSSARWRLLRKLSVTHLFSPQRIEATKALRMKKVQELVKFMDESSKREEAVDISRASFIATLNIISNILFSVDLSSYGSGKSNGFHDSIIGVMEAAGSPDLANFFPFLGVLDLQGTSKKMTLCTEKLFKVFRGLKNTKTAEKSLRKNPKEASTSDFLDALLDEAEPDNNDIEHLLLVKTDVKGKDYELTPFGAGRRICPGLPLAVKMVSLMLVSLLYSFDWKLPNTIDMDETFGISLHKANSLNAVPVKKNRH
ncbi:unnamed protein product [Brassica rapa subsp. trilocularis]